MNMKYIIAVDLGGTITKVGLLRNGELVDYVKMPSRQDLDMTASLPEIENAIDFLLNSNGVKRLFGVGIAFPGLVNNKKSIIISTNEKYDDGVELDLDRWADEHWGSPPFTLIMTHGLQQLENGNMGAAEDMIALL